MALTTPCQTTGRSWVPSAGSVEGGAESAERQRMVAAHWRCGRDPARSCVCAYVSTAVVGVAFLPSELILVAEGVEEVYRREYPV